MAKKPESESPETGKLEVRPYNPLADIAARFPALLNSGVLLRDGSFRTGHLEQVLHEWRDNPTNCERVRADELAYIRAAMPEVLR